ncbi:hypothetical protein AmyhaDRAFT_0121 [Haloechinothrix halophila YIM 93223]|uniref:Uncharacterized protein n=1 Tax=Haloechinothrix halophila YIM 93223 TaxID=592678 RepID=W9DRR8_9PSEU|nr:hypothetical protein AmyhaDRAFT_0121 [Haloechinothrix halophila YIM 93223]
MATKRRKTAARRKPAPKRRVRRKPPARRKPRTATGHLAESEAWRRR